LPCGLELPNRVCKAAMAESMATKTHSPDEKYNRVYGKWADGGWGLILTGNVMVSQTYNSSPADLVVPSPSAPDYAAVQAAWKTWAATCQRAGTPTIVQLCHPGRQSPIGTGNRSIFSKAVAPSPVKLDLGPSFIAQIASSIVFGTPRELTTEEISGPDGITDQFVAGAKQAFDAGFKGVELHAAHGYLLAQFLSPRSNLRTDAFGGTPAKRAAVLLRIITAIRAATSPAFCIGVKLNSVDAASSDSLDDVLEQVGLIVATGVDFIEVSGGTYENPTMMQAPDADSTSPPSSPSPTTTTATAAQARTAAREAFFLQFAAVLRARFPSVLLMVTGGFRSRHGMEAALQSGACDLVGVGRPAAVVPGLPREVVFNKEVSDEEATFRLRAVDAGCLVRLMPVKALGAGAQTKHYAGMIGRMGRGEKPIDSRV